MDSALYLPRVIRRHCHAVVHLSVVACRAIRLAFLLGLTDGDVSVVSRLKPFYTKSYTLLIASVLQIGSPSPCLRWNKNNTLFVPQKRKASLNHWATVKVGAKWFPIFQIQSIHNHISTVHTLIAGITEDGICIALGCQDLECLFVKMYWCHFLSVLGPKKIPNSHCLIQ